MTIVRRRRTLLLALVAWLIAGCSGAGYPPGEGPETQPVRGDQGGGNGGGM